jgi:calcineurin-like phosphoesterase family protein
MRAELVRITVAATATVLTAAACGEPPTKPEFASKIHADQATPDAVRLKWPFVQSSPKGPAVLVGAGDIAACDPRYQDEATALLLDGIDGTVMAVGDEAYPIGSPADFDCYDASWGRHKKRTRPAAGNHEYFTPGAIGYFTYFKKSSNPPLGYYSYNLGSWHVVVLNSTPQVYLCWAPELEEASGDDDVIPPQFQPGIAPPLEPGPAAGRLCLGDAAQQAWLAADLFAHRNYDCTVAYFHHPRFSSGQHGNHYQMQKIWDILYAFGADVVVSGHDHLYERFAPQDPDGNPVEAGIRQFTVGTGGAPLYVFRETQPNSEAQNNTTHGVIKLTLGNGSYNWEFVPAVSGAFTDSGTGACH